MTKDRKKKSILTMSILAIGCFMAFTTGCSQPERFQLIANESNPCVIDTVTGQAWLDKGNVYFKSNKPVNKSGQIGRFKGVIIGEDNYILDTTTGRVWTSKERGEFKRPKIN